MMVETHMLKPYKQRVESTYEFIKSMIEITEEEEEEEEGDRITQIRNEQTKTLSAGETYPLDWTIDTTQFSTLKFKGFEGEMIPSEITSSDRLKYDRSKPFTKDVIYQNYFTPTTEVIIPNAYIIPQGWHNVMELLELNTVEFTQIKKDTILNVESYKIAGYDTRISAYKGHYSHFNTKIITSEETLHFKKVDYIIKTDQQAMRYLLETLEPTAQDSIFN